MNFIAPHLKRKACKQTWKVAAISSRHVHAIADWSSVSVVKEDMELDSKFNTEN